MASDPPFRQAYHVPIDNTVCHEYDREIPGDGSVVVKYTATAISPGDYDSYLDVCINSEVSFLTQPIRTVVGDVTGGPPAPAAGRP